MSEETLTRKMNVRGGGSRPTITSLTETMSTITTFDPDSILRLKLKRSLLLEKNEILKKLNDEILEATPNKELERKIEQSDEV